MRNVRLRGFRSALAVLAAGVVLWAVPAAPALGDSGGVCANGCADPEPPGSDQGAGTAEVLSITELRAVTRRIGFRRPRLAAAIAMAESAGRVDAVGRNRRPRSMDRGLFQINSRWHSEVTDRCAFRAGCNAREAFRISDGGRDWHQWSTWHSRAYEPFL